MDTPSTGSMVTVRYLLSAAITVVQRHTFLLTALSIFFLAIPSAIFIPSFQELRPDDLSGGPALAAFLSVVSSPAFWISAAAYQLVYSLFQGAANWIVLTDLSGQTPELRPILEHAVRAVPSLFGLGLVFLLTVLVGFALFVAPGVALATAWSLAGPALLGERIGILQSLRRSWSLTKGGRWQILGALATPFVAYYLLLSLLDFLIAATAQENSGAYKILLGISIHTLGAFVALFLNVIVCCAYVRLRDADRADLQSTARGTGRALPQYP
ncbi:MAG: hypothetical protein U1E56_14145 [Bauldia sp.]